MFPTKTKGLVAPAERIAAGRRRHEMGSTCRWDERYVTTYRYEPDPGSSPEVNKTSNEKTRRKRTAKRLAAGPLMP